MQDSFVKLTKEQVRQQERRLLLAYILIPLLFYILVWGLYYCVHNPDSPPRYMAPPIEYSPCRPWADAYSD